MRPPDLTTSSRHIDNAMSTNISIRTPRMASVMGKEDGAHTSTHLATLNESVEKLSEADDVIGQAHRADFFRRTSPPQNSSWVDKQAVVVGKHFPPLPDYQ